MNLLIGQLGIEPNWLAVIAFLAIGVVGLTLLAGGLPKLRGTTLVAPWGWALFAWCSLFVVEILLALQLVGNDETSAASWRLLSATTLFCPQLAQMGAKRPQSGYCQGIVFAYWILLSIPVFKLWLNGQDGVLAPSFLWQTLYVVGIAVGLLNNGLTRYAPTALPGDRSNIGAGSLFPMVELCHHDGSCPGRIMCAAAGNGINCLWVARTVQEFATREFGVARFSRCLRRVLGPGFHAPR